MNTLGLHVTEGQVLGKHEALTLSLNSKPFSGVYRPKLYRKAVKVENGKYRGARLA